MSAPTSAKAAELEFLIASYGQDLIRTYANGDKTAAYQHQRDMYQAIALRTPAQVAVMEIERGLAA